MVQALINTGMYLGAAIVLVAAFLYLFTRITPYPEFDLIRDGNAAAAASLSGALVGFVHRFVR